MALCRFIVTAGPDPWSEWGWVEGGTVWQIEVDPAQLFDGCIDLAELSGRRLSARPYRLDQNVDSVGRTFVVTLAAPLAERMEVWAAGVTYESSKFARMAESGAGGDFYAKVYVADRPELFFKATPNRVAGPNDPVRIRADSRWNVPEPELAAVIAANGRILGYTIGNDMSSRDIEGENPLYLPQAKVYTRSCALGPWIIPAASVDAQNLPIRLTITRRGETAFAGETSTARMRRTVAELAEWLFRENEFPNGVVLLTGTGIIPPDDFTLKAGDEIDIEIEGIGTLRNIVA